MNVNSPDISTIDFKVLWNLSTTEPSVVVENKMVGTALANTTAWFEIYSPSGNIIHKGIQLSPDVTGAWSVWTNSTGWGGVMDWSGAPFTIRVNVSDSAGNVFSFEDAVTIRKPSGNKDKNRFGAATTGVNVRCDQGAILFKNETNASWCGREGSLVSSVLRVIYPVDETDSIPEPFSVTSFSTLLVPVYYDSDNYQFVSSQVYDYKVTETSTVRIKYTERQTFSVNCSLDLSYIVHCYNKLIDSSKEGGCGKSESSNLQKVTSKLSLLLLGISQPLAGVNVPKTIKQIQDLLGDDCDCSIKKTARGINRNTSSSVDGYNFSVTNEGGDVIGSFANSVGKNIILTLKDRQYIFRIGQSTLDTTDAFSIIPSVSGNTSIFDLNVSVADLAMDIAEIIKDSPSIFNTWKTLFGYGEAIKIVVDGRCIFNSNASCDYSFLLTEIPTTGSYAILTRLSTDSINRVQNYSFNQSNLTGLQTQLNSLGLGVFVVNNLGGGNVSVQSTGNTNNLTNLVYRTGATAINASLERVCSGFQELSLDEFAAHVVNYLCELSTSNISIDNNYTINWIDSNGNNNQVTIPEGSTLSDLLNELINKGNQTVEHVKTLGAVNCTNIRKIFPFNLTNTLQRNDIVVGTRGGDCAGTNVVDMFNKQLEFAMTDAQALYNFCQLVKKCSDGEVCQPLSYFEIIETNSSTLCAEPIGVVFDLS